jgi:hypothetical protein
VHGEELPVQLGFGGYDSSEDEREEEKKQNVQITKENYRDNFPTLSATNRNEGGTITGNRNVFDIGSFPAMPSARNTGNQKKVATYNRPQTAKKPEQKFV